MFYLAKDSLFNYLIMEIELNCRFVIVLFRGKRQRNCLFVLLNSRSLSLSLSLYEDLLTQILNILQSFILTSVYFLFSCGCF